MRRRNALLSNARPRTTSYTRCSCAKRDRLGQQEGGERRVFHLSAQPVKGGPQDLLVVEGEANLEGLAGRGPPRRRLTIGLHRRLPGERDERDQGEVGVRGGPAARVAIATAPASQLLEVGGCDTGLFAQLAAGALEVGDPYRLRVWPVHCEIGSWGHNVYEGVRCACNRWEQAALQPVRKVLKGMNAWPENSSALQVEMPDPQDPPTRLNIERVRALDESDKIWTGAEASSHCLRVNTEHLRRTCPPAALASWCCWRIA